MHVIIVHKTLSRAQQGVRKILDQGEQGQKPVMMWSDYVSDLWEKHLPHLRETIVGGGAFVYDPATGRYGFQEGDYEDDTISDELAVSLNIDEVDEKEKVTEDIKLSAIIIEEQEENQQSQKSAGAIEDKMTENATSPGKKITL